MFLLIFCHFIALIKSFIEIKKKFLRLEYFSNGFLTTGYEVEAYLPKTT